MQKYMYLTPKYMHLIPPKKSVNAAEKSGLMTEISSARPPLTESRNKECITAAIPEK